MNMNSELRSPYIYEGIEYMTLFHIPLSHKAPVHNGYSYGIDLVVDRYRRVHRCLGLP